MIVHLQQTLSGFGCPSAGELTQISPLLDLPFMAELMFNHQQLLQ
jgi:hypothetical protein